MTLQERAYNQEFKLNDTDDSVIEYILAHRTEMQSISIHKIAEALYISPNAVMRTAKKLGYSGFSELKFSLQKEENPEDIRTVENRVLDKMPQNIVKTLDVMEDEVMQKMITMMLEAKQIIFAGVGESVYFCELFGKYLRCLDKNVQYHYYIHDMEYAVRNAEKEDMVIIISASGATERLIEIAKKAKEKEVSVACITHYGQNPLQKASDLQLCFWGEKRIVNGYNVTDRSGLMMLVRLICEGYWKRFCV